MKIKFSCKEKRKKVMGALTGSPYEHNPLYIRWHNEDRWQSKEQHDMSLTSTYFESSQKQWQRGEMHTKLILKL